MKKWNIFRPISFFILFFAGFFFILFYVCILFCRTAWASLSLSLTLSLSLSLSLSLPPAFPLRNCVVKRAGLLFVAPAMAALPEISRLRHVRLQRQSGSSSFGVTFDGISEAVVTHVAQGKPAAVRSCD